MTVIDAQRVSPSLSVVLRSLEKTTSRLGIWLRQDPTLESSAPVQSHHGSSEVSRSPILPANLWDYEPPTMSTRRQNHVQKDQAAYIPVSCCKRDKPFVVFESHETFESPISYFNRLLDSGPLVESIWLPDQTENLQTYPACRHRSEIFVGCDTPDENNHIEYYTQQTGAQYSSSTPQPPFIFDPFGSEDSATAGIFHSRDGIRSYAQIPDRELDPIVPRKDTTKRRRRTVKEVVLGEDDILDASSRIHAWLEDVSKAMVGEDL